MSDFIEMHVLIPGRNYFITNKKTGERVTGIVIKQSADSKTLYSFNINNKTVWLSTHLYTFLEDEIYTKFLQFIENNPRNLDELEKKIFTALNISHFNSSSDLNEFYREVDDNNYSKIKWTNIPINTYLLHRQTDTNWNQTRDLWCDYSGRIEDTDGTLIMNSPSFLNKPFFNNPIFSKLGQNFMIFKVIRPIRILHFPIIDDFSTKELNVPASYETLIKYICTYQNAEECLDGYTMDFLTFYNHTEIPLYGTYFPGYREICILGRCNNSTYLELVSPSNTEQIFRHFELISGGNNLHISNFKKNKNKGTKKRKYRKQRKSKIKGK